MINTRDNPAEWALFISELEDAQEHLEALISGAADAGSLAEEDLQVYLGHIYAHLNRAWNSRDRVGTLRRAAWEEFSAFPSDIKPIG
jgi:hypothetical protein